MARIRPDQPLLPSVLDRLLDSEPASANEPIRNRQQILEQLKLSVRRDLEWLLNTRRRVEKIPKQFQELQNSLLTYGLPDFSTVSPTSNKDREALSNIIASIIRQQEPRLMDIRVTLLGNSEPQDRTLRFRIEAMLRADPAPEPVLFDSALEPTTGTFFVSDGDA